MTWKMLFSSSLGKKYTMSLTGIFLILFLIVHVGVNACVFISDNGETYNTAAHFMSHNWVLRILEIGLFAGIFLHIIQGLILWKQNQSARAIKYAVSDPAKNSKWYSRSMGLLGTLLLLFLIIHISDFFVGTKVALYSGDRPHNVYEDMKIRFSNWWVVTIYIAGVVSLYWHLRHGFQSSFQSLGINHKKYTPIIKAIGAGYSFIVCLLFILMPLAFYFKWID